jgi:hypothetical protein
MRDSKSGNDYFTQRDEKTEKPNFPYADWVESTLEQSLRARYEETYRRLREAFRDMGATHRAILELQRRQSAEGRVVTPFQFLPSWGPRKASEQIDDKSSTLEQSQ